MAEKQISNEVLEKISNMKVHGFPNAYASSSWPRRLTWLLITWVAMAFCLLGVTTTIMRYYRHPVVVDLSFKDEALSTFPAVTICNLNKMRKSQKKTRSFLSSFKPTIRDTEEVRDAVGHQISDMLRLCNYKGKQCETSDFVLVNGSLGQYGNCYTFNSGFTKPMDVMNDLITGRAGALVLMLNSEQDEYTERTEASGFEVKLHDPGQYPTPESKTLSIAPGSSTFIELSQARLRRALKPYGECEAMTPGRNQLLNIWSRYGYHYSQSACKFTQKQMLMINLCDCYYNDMPPPEHLENSLKPCSRLSGCVFKATVQFYATSSWSHICPYPCEEALYETTVSNHRWPSEPGMKRILKYLPSSNMSLEDARKNLAKVSIYYESSRIKTIGETPLYQNIFALLGEIGGHLGLWIGVSLLAVCELFEIAYDGIRLGISYM